MVNVVELLVKSVKEIVVLFVGESGKFIALIKTFARLSHWLNASLSMVAEYVVAMNKTDVRSEHCLNA